MKENIITVSQLTNAISNLLRNGIGTVSVQGEISNFLLHGSGHRYFSLKEEGAQISCVMWRTRPLNFQPADGMKVIAKGTISVYPPRGQYQLECSSLFPVGQGDLYLAFEALKKKLDEAGYFEPSRKKPLPRLPMKIGVITSATGAAIRDIFSTIERRFPAMTILFRPAIVQGAEAAEDIAKAIAELQNTDVELIITGRGGGSIEDLWPFNEEIVADAIFNSTIPIISAVGHETDFTISDFVSDVRSATPTAAAELATPITMEQIEEFIIDSRADLQRSIKRLLQSKIEIIDNLEKGGAYRRVREKINVFKRQTDEYENRISKRINQLIALKKQKAEHLEKMRLSLYPLSPLRKGFSILKFKGKIISKNESLQKYKKFDIIRDIETVSAKVERILPKELF